MRNEIPMNFETRVFFFLNSMITEEKESRERT